VIRQRVRISRDGWTVAGQVVVAALALGLVWGGAVVLVLAAGARADRVDSLSSYRSVWAAVRDLGAADVAGRWWLVAGCLVAAVLLARMAVAQAPRPRLARHALALGTPGARVDVAPRAVERAAEVAAAGAPGVRDARARLGDDELLLSLQVGRRADVATALTGARDRAVSALARHELPALPVRALVTHTERKETRDLA
jgi:hypothetical protein